MNKISDLLDAHGHFHDWYLETITIRGNVNPRIPDTLILGIFESERSAKLTFRGVTRLGIEDGGLLNIVNAIEMIDADSPAYQQAQRVLAKSAHDERRAIHTAYLYSTVGAEIAVEFDSLHIETSSRSADLS
jgi:hypothetical protein